MASKLPEPSLSENAHKVLKKRYLHKNIEGQIIETPKDRFLGVARAVGGADEKYGAKHAEVEATVLDFYLMMADTEFIPNTPCLANAGWAGSSGQLSACFVLPIDDSMESIFTTLKHMALIHQSGGGTGFAFSRLRPKDDFVRSTTGVASGPVSFMEAFNNVTEVVKQSGIRRGANMGILRVDHPDVLQFITSKSNPCEQCKERSLERCNHRLQNFNISVAITNKFMEALKAGTDYELVNPRTKAVTGRLSAEKVWQAIVANAWANGDPGLFFIDRVNLLDPLSEYLGDIEATNPCGEVPLRAFDACTLGSLNLFRFLKYEDRKWSFDWGKLREGVRKAVHFLDNVLTINQYPVPEIYEVTSSCRKIGLGVMGWANALVKLGIPYASDEAVSLGRTVMKTINDEAIHASERLAEVRGPFKHWEHSKWAKEGHKPRRNSTVTVIAPTGTISIIAGCSGGIEPDFAVVMERFQAEMRMLDVNHEFERVAKEEGWWTDDLPQRIFERGGGVQGMSEVPEKWQRVFQISNEIPVEWHIKHQAAFQAFTEDAVSKTINLPREAKPGDIEAAYALAWELGCKGITVYRDGSRENQVLSTGMTATQVQATGEPNATQNTERRRIPQGGRRPGETLTKATPVGSVHVTINRHPVDQEEFELWASIGKGASEVGAFTEALGRTASLLLQIPSPIPPRQRLDMMAEQLAGIGGGNQVGFGEGKVLSGPDGIGKAILDYLYAGSGTTAPPPPRKSQFDICPSCKQATLAKSAKCDTCQNPTCGYSKC